MKSWIWMPAAALAMLACTPTMPAAKEKTRFLEKLDREFRIAVQGGGAGFKKCGLAF